MMRGLLFLLTFLCISGTLLAQSSELSIDFPDQYYLEGQVMIDEDQTRLEVCNVQPGKTYMVYMYDEREKDKRVCEYSYGQTVKGTDEFIEVIAQKECLYIDIDRYDCKFKSSIIVNVLMHCMNCDPIDEGRDPNDDFSCDLKMKENDDYLSLIEDILLAKTCFEVDASSINGRGMVGDFWQGHFS